jgi:hypothetical protein
VFGHKRASDLVSEMHHIVGDEVGHVPIRGMAPTMLDGMEFRRLRWQVCDMHTGAIDRLEEPGGFAVATRAIPNQQQGALQVTIELLHKGKEILAREIV